MATRGRVVASRLKSDACSQLDFILTRAINSNTQVRVGNRGCPTYRMPGPLEDQGHP